MNNLDQIKARYLKESFDRRLGHLASNLLRIGNFLESSINIRVVDDILEESKFFIEWIAPEASFNVQAILSEIQLKLALAQHRLQHKQDMLELDELRKITKDWSKQLLEISGLLAA